MTWIERKRSAQGEEEMESKSNAKEEEENEINGEE